MIIAIRIGTFIPKLFYFPQRLFDLKFYKV